MSESEEGEYDSEQELDLEQEIEEEKEIDLPNSYNPLMGNYEYTQRTNYNDDDDNN